MNSQIKLINTFPDEDSFCIQHEYEYKFYVDSELDAHELIRRGFKEDFIEILLQDFEKALRESIDEKK